MFDLREFKTNPPASAESIEALVAYVGRSVPALYLELLKTADGLEAGELVYVYALEDVLERSEAFSARECAPGYLLIGGDGGGRAIMLELGVDDPPVFLVDHGSMSPDDMEFVAESLSSWIDSGFPLPDDEDYPFPFQVDDRVDIYLERPPKTGLKGLMLTKKELILDIGILRLKELSAHVPALLVSGVAYGTGSSRCSKVNTVDDCLRIRAHGAAPDSPGYE